MYFVFTHIWLIRDVNIVHSNKRCFIYCLQHLELRVLQQLKLLQALEMVHRPQIVYECSSSHDKIKNNVFCIVSWLTLVNFPALVANSFIVVHACTFSHSQLAVALCMCLPIVSCPKGIKLMPLPSGTWNTAAIKVAVRVF